MSNVSAARRLRRLSPLLAAESFVLITVLCFTGAITPARAVLPTASPSASADPGPLTSPPPLADPTVSPDPTVQPTPDPSVPGGPTTSPDPSTSPDPFASGGPTASPDPGANPSAEPSAAPTPAPPPAPSATLHVDHAWVDSVDLRTGAIVPGDLDAAASGVQRGRIYVVRFQLVNGTDSPIELRPTVEIGTGGEPAAWLALPAGNPVDGVALYSSANVLRGEDPGTAPITIDELRLATADDPGGLPGPGVAHAGVNPGPAIMVPAHGFTELAFTIRATAAADWLATYRVRLADDAVLIDGAGVATIRMGDRPAIALSPGQRSGVTVEPPVVYRSSTRGNIDSIAAGPVGPSAASPHGAYTLTSDACASCHASHDAASSMLLVRAAPQSAMCFTCHGGSGATSNIAAQYSDPTVPANNASTGSYYSHAATVVSNHTSDRDPAEFAGVLNRHTACSDCHQPHQADANPAVETGAGWTASGALKGASGVAVANGGAGDPPTYSWKPAVSFEYELCFKCHSGFTTPRPPTGGPSTWALDKGVELNPANLSYHPVEAAGKNQTSQMNLGLSGDQTYGTSPYKLWIFTSASTIRCVSCHGDPRLANPASPPAAGGRLAPHAVVNRGMLIANLRDRVLKGSSEAYNAADFALCYVCHAEAPFVDTSMGPLPDTNFPLHGKHTAAIASFLGPSGTVDDPGAGHGNALCAECHFRTHGTSFAVNDQPAWSRLVNFAPNVLPYQGSNPVYLGQLIWDATTHTCTLTCHGVDHEAWKY